MRGDCLGVMMCAALGAAACSGTHASDAGSGGARAVTGGQSVGGTSNDGGATTSGGKTGGVGATGGAAQAGAGSASGGALSSAGSAGLSASAGSSGAAGKASGGASTGGVTAGGSTGKGTGGSGGKGSGGTAGGSGTGGSGGGVSCTGTTAGYKLIWSDEFDGPAGAAVDAKDWTLDVGGTGWGNNELEYYTDGASNAALDGAGNLVITAKKEATGGKSYTSARIKTLGLREFTYGRVEARLKIPSGQGIWPAFWMLGNDIGTASWPACGEIDVMENRGRDPNIILGTLHGPGYSGGAGPTQSLTLSAPVASAFHVFAIEWEQTAIRWYIDSTLYSTKTTSDIPSGATWVYAHPFFIILNVAVGGQFGGDPDSTTVFPQTMQVDYVRVCQK